MHRIENEDAGHLFCMYQSSLIIIFQFSKDIMFVGELENHFLCHQLRYGK